MFDFITPYIPHIIIYSFIFIIALALIIDHANKLEKNYLRRQLERAADNSRVYEVKLSEIKAAVNGFLLPYEEYKAERMKDGNYSEKEAYYFEMVSPYCFSESEAKKFSPEWR